jgi:hypothetical protein
MRLRVQMMEVLSLDERARIVVRNKKLPKASFVQFRPKSKMFYDFADPKALYVTARRSHASMILCS